MAFLTEKNILLISNEPWGDVWYSKHNYAYELSKNNTVFFLNPVGKWSLKSVFSPITKKEISSNLFVVEYTNAIPSINTFLLKLNNYLISKRLYSYFKKINNPIDIVWNFDPFRLFVPKLLRPSISLFHVVDPYGFYHIGETLLTKNSDIVLSVAEELAPSYKNINPNTHYIPHAISSEEFNVSENVSISIPWEEYGLYIGTRVNWKLLETLLINLPNVPFVVIGPINTNNNPIAKRLIDGKQYANLFALGPIHFKKTKYYIEKATYCIIFSEIDQKFAPISSHKMLPYLALGKPVIMTYNFAAYGSIKGFTYTVNNEQELIQSCKEILATTDSTEIKEKRIAYATKYTFENTLRTIESIIIESLKESRL